VFNLLLSQHATPPLLRVLQWQTSNNKVQQASRKMVAACSVCC
jgi:hypothetical protein